MRAFAGGYYNNLKAMYDYLGVKYHSQPFLFEFAKAQKGAVRPGTSERDRPYFIHASNLHQMPPPRPSTVATIAYLTEVLYLIACYTWFSLCCSLVAPRTVPDGEYGGVSESLDGYLRRIRLSRYFINCYLLPLISSVSTCPHESLLAFPASDVIEYKRRTHGAPHYTVSNGVNTVQNTLIKDIEYELSAAVSAIEPLNNGVKISWRKIDRGGRTHEEFFDRVVLAVAPDIVGAIFEPLKHFMARIPTTVVESIVHTDWNSLGVEAKRVNIKDSGAQLIYLRTSEDGASKTESLHIQPCGAIVTTCPFSPIDPCLTIHSAKFTRVLRSPESRKIINGIFGGTQELYGNEKSIPLWKNGQDNVWLVGGWCWDGMVLLEGCVLSAVRVADAFGVHVPWR
ncbi:hypothetical protein CC78DRAFT_223520 [Lojkania enalia]|uniref:Amine oxidase domain-containing protein n=1 Tax=Lojkania enalia TaxID=147567 RepID=A0A9P4KA30_9PLEO|nr:hypothetical protein CC78DRAFT_223520 [Didymosphaeria enalia]